MFNEEDELYRKLEWAEDHIRDLKAQWDEFAKDAYSVSHHDDVDAGERVYKLDYALTIPPRFPLILGDALHNLRCALDHIAYRLVFVDTNGKGPFERLYFPIAGTSAAFKEALTRTAEYKPKGRGVIQRLGETPVNALNAIEPYEGGQGAVLWHIHQLDIIDKHHLLLAVGLSNPTHSSLPSEMAEIKKDFLGIEKDFPPAVASRVFLRKALKRVFPLITGAELLRIPFSEVDENMYFAFEIAFGEPKIIEGKSVLETFHRAANLIRHIIMTFNAAGLLTIS